MDTFWQDVKYGLRMLRKHPGVTVAAVLTLGLAIGANTSLFSMVNVYVLRSPKFTEPDRLMHVWETNRRQGYDKYRASLPNVLDWKQQNQSFSDLGAFNYTEENLVGPEGPERVYAGRVSANVFDILGVQPALGRGFRPGEDEPGRGDVVVLSDRFWKLRHAGDPKVLGQTLNLNDRVYTIVGVMPPEFAFPLNITQVWAPRELDVAQYPREQRFLQVVGRLKPGVTRQQAQAEMSTIAKRLESEHPKENADAGVNVTPLKHELNFGYDIFQIMALVMGVAGGFLLLTTCANVSNLTVSRALGRTREVAIRAALGASRGRVVRQLLTESLLLAAAGGVLGAALARSILSGTARMIPEDLYHVGDLGVDAAALVFVFALCLLTAALVGLAPALQTSRPDLTESLKEGGAGAGLGRRRQRLQSSLGVVQVGLGLVMLVGAALIAQSFAQMQRAKLGFETENVLTMKLVLPKTRYNTADKRSAFHRDVIHKAQGVPGVTAAATVDFLPFNHETSSIGFRLEGQEENPQEDGPAAVVLWVSPGFFRVMQIPLRQGRAFTEQDDARSETAVVVSDALAEKYFPGGDAVGRRILLKRPKGEIVPAQIVGVVGGIKYGEFDARLPMQIYRPQFQNAGTYLRLVVRTTQPPAGLAGALRDAVWRVDNRLPVTEVRTLGEVVAEFLLPQQVMTVSLGVFAAGALALASVGLFAVLAFSVAQRTREIGVRVALGAQRGDILRLVLRQGLKLVLTGVGIGLAAAFGVAQLLAGLLYGVSSTDVKTFLGAPLLLIAVAVLACYIPARRAARVEPMVALRYE